MTIPEIKIPAKKSSKFFEFQKFSYCCYLKKELKATYEPPPGEKVTINGKPFTRTGLEKEIDGTPYRSNTALYRSIFKWLGKDAILEEENLKLVYFLFRKGDEINGYSILSFKDYLKDEQQVADRAEENIADYLKNRSQNENAKPPFDIIEGLGFISYYRNLALSSSQTSNEDNEKAMSSLWLIFGLLTDKGNTPQKDKVLADILKIESAENRYSQPLKELKDKIEDYRKSYPISRFQEFIGSKAAWVIASLFIMAILGLVYMNIREEPGLSPDFIAQQEEYLQSQYVSNDSSELQLSLVQYLTIDTPKVPKFDSTEYWYQKARKTYLNGQQGFEMEYLDKAIELSPTRWDIYRFRAIVKSNYPIQDFKGAIDDYTVVMHHEKEKDYFLYGERGRLKMFVKDYDGAALDFDTSLALISVLQNDTMPKVWHQNKQSIISGRHYDIAFANYKQGNYLKALDSYKTAISFIDTSYDKEVFEKYNGLALTYARLDSFIPAIDTYGEALHHCTFLWDTCMSYDGIFNCYKALGDKDYERFLKSQGQKELIKTHYNGAITYLDKILSYGLDKDSRLKYEEQKSLLLSRIEELKR